MFSRQPTNKCMKNVIMTDKTKYNSPIDVFSGSILT